jgi:flagellar motor switch protein FliG
MKAAITLLTLGEKFAGEVFKSLDEDEIKELGRQMSLIRNVPQELVEATLTEFNKKLGSDLDLLVKGDDFVRKALTNAMGNEADSIIEELDNEAIPEPFSKVKDVDPKVLANFIQNEHPQTVAVIVAHLDSSKAGEVIREFPEGLQYEVILRMATLEPVPPAVVREIDSVLEEEVMTSVDPMAGGPVGGVQAVAELLNHVDKATEESILERLDENKSDLADQVRALMFVFEDVAGIDDRGIRTILREVSNEDLTMALKTASEDLKSKILGNVSERASAMIMEDLEVMGPVRLSDVERAQQTITRVARRLEKEGKIFIGGKGGEDAFV